MKVRAQIAMVMNLDKCIGCHTCSVTCKNVWTSREGVEYAWFNNVETKPGIGFPDNWENQNHYRGGWEMKKGSLHLKQGGRSSVVTKLFGNPRMPQIDDYYEPFTFDYEHLQKAGISKTSPVATPISLISGEKMEKIEKGPNWEDMLGGEFSKRKEDTNFRDMEKEMYKDFEKTFMMYLPRICEHCLNPSCIASCPSGSIYKRDEDGIVLIDQEKCRSWRMCVSGCPYKKIYYNWKSNKAEKCTLCYPRLEAGEPTLCSESCVGRIRYLGVMLYDADKIKEIASVEKEEDLYEMQLQVFLDPHDEEVCDMARKEGIPDSWIVSAQKSPVYQMISNWKIAFPLHPEYRTLPMVWYIPSLSPIQKHVGKNLSTQDEATLISEVEDLRIPVKYLANLLTGGKEEPIVNALKKMTTMRLYMRSALVLGKKDPLLLEGSTLTEKMVEEMYKLLAIANYEDRFVIPTSNREKALSAYQEKGSCGFTVGDCSPTLAQEEYPKR